MRPIELLGKILIEGYHADIQTSPDGILLIVKPQQILSNLVGGMIRNAGFKFRSCYSEANGRTVLLFLKEKANSS
jgi:hypothetical protein